MRNIRRNLWHGLTLLALVLTGACSADTAIATGLQPSAPSAAKLSTRLDMDDSADLDSVDTPFVGTVQVLGRKAALARAVTASAVIGEYGGTIRIPETGFSLHVPMGALSKTTRISVTAMPGSGVAYHFEPHGLRFNKAVWFTQDTRYTESVAGREIGGAYFKDDRQVDNHGKKAAVDAIYQVNLDALGMILFGIHHFSGYLVSCA